MLHAKIIDIKENKINISNAEKFIASSKCGASIYFVGTVRDLNNKKKVTGMTYDSHDPLVIKSFAFLNHIVFGEALFYDSPRARSPHTPCSTNLINKVTLTNADKLFTDRLPSLIHTCVALLAINGRHCCTAALGYL